MERRVRNVVFDLALNNIIKSIFYTSLVILAVKFFFERFPIINLKADYKLGFTFIFILYFSYKLYQEIDREILKDLDRLEIGIRKDSFDEKIEISEFREISRSLARKNQEILERNKFINTSLAAISHDMKTPLTVIATNLSLIRSFDEKDRTRIEKIRGESQKIEKYIEELMDVSAGLIEKPKLEKISIDSFITSLRNEILLVEDLMEEEIPIKGAYPLSGYFIEIDRNKFSKSLNQLLTNALNYKENKLWLELNASNNKLTITVADDGKGFDSKAISHAKDLFYTDNSARTWGRGYGLGLYLADIHLKTMGMNLVLTNDNGARASIVVKLMEEK